MKEKSSIYGVSWYDRGHKLFTVTGYSPLEVLRRLFSLILVKYQSNN
jgi:hypothetical protein